MIAAWPALAGVEADRGSIRYSRAVRGKVHRATSDYRWIALSPGFDPESDLGTRTITVSTEDEPRQAFAWKPQGGGYIAVHCYASRARDATGRPGGVEKQLLYWEPASDLAPAAAAFFLLPEVARLDDTVWWETWNNPAWSDHRYSLPISDSRPLAWDANSLQSLIRSGIGQIQEKVSADSLAGVYQHLLSNRTPAFLTTESDSLSPEAIAALLLPLPPEHAARVSILSGLPDSRLSPDRLQTWSIVISRFPANSTLSAGAEAQQMARSLLSGNPAPIAAKGVVAPAPEKDKTAERLKQFLDSDQVRALRGPDLASQDWRAIRSEAEIIALIERVRRLESDLDADRTYASDPERQSARVEHLRVKYDQARAWLYIFAPGSKTLEQAPPRPGSPVAPLLYAHMLSPDDWRLLERYSDQDWGVLIARSLKDGRLPKQTRDWLARYVATVPESRRRLLEGYLA